MAYNMKFEGIIMSLLNGILIELEKTCVFATDEKNTALKSKN